MSTSLAELTRVFARIGVLSFGGPAAQIALMHRVLVDEQGWLEEKQFLNALSFCMLLPGPEAMQLATYSGWRLRGVPGGLLAGLLFVVPGAAVVLLLAITYMALGHEPLMQWIFLGIKAAVLVIVIEALLRVARKALEAAIHWWIAGLAFVAIFFFGAPFPAIVLLSGAAGFLFIGRGLTEAPKGDQKTTTITATLGTIFLWLVLWWAPILLLALTGAEEVLIQLGNFFSRLAVVTFGGAYAVLAYLAQDVVVQHGWLTAGEMMDGLGLAETTPGPLILVTEFVGYIAAYRAGGVGLGIIGALVTLWVTFVPCFLWIFAGAPYIERITAQPRLKGALVAITAAVVGVILNLSLWFGFHVLFSTLENRQIGPLHLLIPEWGTLDWRVVLIGVVCAGMLLWKHQSLFKTLCVAGLMGVALNLL